MPLYDYEAVEPSGKKIRASIDAPDEASLKEDLKRKGLIPISIRAARQREPLIGLKRITRKDILRFTNELGSLLESGVPIDKALLILSEHSESAEMRRAVRAIYLDIQRGLSLSQALASQGSFPRLYVNMIKAGEAGGILEPVIKRLSSFLEMTQAFKDEVISALIYPALLTVVGGLAIAVLMIYVVPRFAQIFEDMGQALPTPTVLLLNISAFFASYWWIGLGLIILTLVLIRIYSRTHEGRLFLDGLKLNLPVARTLHMKFVISRFTRTLGTLMASGVPILEAIRISREVVGNEVISEKLSALEDGVRKGRGVAVSLRESAVFPPLVVQMIAVGEETGKLEETFLRVADRFEAETRSLIKRAINLLEPAMIFIMGIIVGFIVISMLIAVFSINEIPI